MGNLVGRAVAHFRIVEKIGEGGMGVVYKATDERLRRTVALKVLPESLAENPERRSRLVREARAAAAVTHPNIAMVHDVGEADGCVYIAMEYVEGRPLRELLERGPLSLPSAMRIALQIARGLARAHQANVVHRDLKPDNVMVGEDEHVKLVDFGLAKQWDDEPASPSVLEQMKTATQMTGMGRLLGTPGYMSPEQARGKEVDGRTDVFAFGVVLFEMVTGQRPFVGESMADVLTAIARDEPKRPSELNALVPPEVDRIVSRCLDKLPDARYGSGQELVDALLLLAPEPRVSEPTVHRQSASAPTASLLTPAAASVTPRPAGSRRWVLFALGVAVLAAGGVVLPRLRTQAPRPPTARSASASAAVVPTAITDLPPPRTNNPEAAMEYAAAMQAWRDGSWPNGHDHLRRALRLDPSFPAAHLAMAMNGSSTLDEARKHAVAAASQRSLLSERDGALLAAVQAEVATDSHDFDASLKRARSLVERFPGDAQIVFLAGNKELEAAHPKEGFALLDRAAALDPKFAMPYVARADYQKDTGDLDGVVETSNACLAVAPSAASCLRRRADVEQRRGQCDLLEADARKMIAMEPEGAYAYTYLTSALIAQGAPAESVAEVIHRAQERWTDPVDKELHEAFDPVSLALLSGDFGAAMAAVPRLERFAASSASDGVVGDVVNPVVLILDEEGLFDQSLAVVDGYMKRMPALIQDNPLDARPAALLLWHRAGRIEDAEFRAKREAWAAEAKARLPGRTANLAWLHFFAHTASTPEDARSALDALPRYSPLPPFDGIVYYERVMGNVLLLAGRVDEAIPHLRRAVAACFSHEYMFSHHIAAKLLGEALEAKEDTPGACAAYAQVLVHWGNAKPRSLTADAARTHMKKLGCPP